ncbi:MAG TPA: hypothetical protein VIR54_28265 [Vicinamibacterales bacterium]
MGRRLVHLTMLCAFVVGVGMAAAAELQDRTRRAYEEYAARATQLFVDRARDGASGNATGEPSRSAIASVRPAREDGILSIPGGLIHHWTGSMFISGVTLQDALDVSFEYDAYHTIYTPVVASRLLGRDGDTFRVLLRIKGSGGGLSATLDVTSRVQYFYPADGRVYSISSSEDIREITHPGTPAEGSRPAGHDSGYLWRAATFNSLLAVDSGVFAETETLGLSRGFPPMLGWFIEPIAKRLGRESVRKSLQEFSAAVKARAKARQH